MDNDLRLLKARDWLDKELSLVVTRLEPASADASFRRYFRVWTDADTTRILMDAPPDKEDLGAYLKVSSLLESCDVHVPHVHAADTALGFSLLEDLGSRHMLTSLSAGEDAQILYRDALEALAQLQLRGDAASRQLPPYDEAVLLREMRLLPEWFCGVHLGLSLTVTEQQLLEDTFAFLAREALAQPQVFVHRDYHSRNLMVLPERSPGVIDFQDALRGPVGYDLASILKDCYVDWPRQQVETWVTRFRALLEAGGDHGRHLACSSPAQFLRGFDLIGLQRHLKVLGIFARLRWRDGKPGYLSDLPRTLAYARETAHGFPELAGFARFVDDRLMPQLAPANARALTKSGGLGSAA